MKSPFPAAYCRSAIYESQVFLPEGGTIHGGIAPSAQGNAAGLRSMAIDNPSFSREEPPMGVDLSPAPAVLRSVVFAIKEERLHDAARFLVAAGLDHKIPDGRALAPWLSRKVGAVAMRQLIEAFATYPCFVCRGGYEVCQSCRGEGTTRSTLCEPCLGFGVCNCKFCSGSGWVTINFVPQGFRFLTALHRVRSARHQMKQILVEGRLSRRKVPQGRMSFDRKETVAVILRWNRLLTVIENAILALRLSCSHEPMDASMRDQWIARCNKYGARADVHVRRKLADLALNSEGSEAGFYAEVSEDPTVSDELQHLLFRRAMAESRRKRPKGTSVTARASA